MILLLSTTENNQTHGDLQDKSPLATEVDFELFCKITA